MTNFLRWLFGINAPPSDMPGATWRISFNSLPEGPWAWLSILAALAAVVGVWWLYRREGRNLGLGARLALSALRIAILLLAAAMLLEIVVVLRNRELIPSHLPVLVDMSESMGLTDPYVDEAQAKEIAKRLQLVDSQGAPQPGELRAKPRLALAQGALERVQRDLARGRVPAYYGFATHVEPVDDAAHVKDLKASGPATGIGDALANVLAKHRGQPLAGIVVVSDGRSNAGDDPLKIAQQAAADGIPIYSVAVGTPQGPRNVRITELESSPVVFVRDTTEIAALVESRGLVGQTVSVTLEQRPVGGAWTEIGSEDLVLGEDGTIGRVSFRVTPEATGQFEYRARTGDVGPEVTDADNTASATIKVVRQKIRVLLVAGYPSPEFQFLRNALLRDNAVEFASWLQAAGENYEHIGHRPIRRLPATQSELDHYDVLVLFDPNVAALGGNWGEMITKFVGDAGGGLIYMAGELFSRQLFYPSLAGNEGSDNSWIKVLPIVCDPGLYQSSAEARLSARETWTLELTSAGYSDQVFRFNNDASQNREVIASLPGMYWHFPVTRSKPGATVLARHGDPRMQNSFGRHVLMATHLYGPGRTVFLGFDSTYRWRYLDEKYFDEYWARLIDRVGRSKVLGGRYPFTLATDKSAYRIGDRVTVRAQFTNSADLAGGITELTGEVELADQPPMPLALVPQTGDSTLFEASFPAQEAGAYTVRVTPNTLTDSEGGPRPATLNFRVEPPRQEVDNPTLNRVLLDDLARLTDGKTLAIEDAEALPTAIRIREVERIREFRDEIWDAPLFFGGLVLLLTTEWVLRKMYRMS